MLKVSHKKSTNRSHRNAVISNTVTPSRLHIYRFYLAEDDCDQALELNKKLKSELNSFDPCPVMDYVKQTAQTQDIKKTVAEMHRKVDINQLMKKTYIKQLRGLNSGYLHQ